MENKKLKAYLMATTMLMTPLVLCTQENNCMYEISENGETQLTGTISYDTLKKCKIIELKKSDESEIFLTEQEMMIFYAAPLRITYTDIMNNETVYNNYELAYMNTKLINVSDFTDYLDYYGEVKKEYTEEEIKNIMEKIKNEQKKEKGKVMSKGMI